MPRWLTWTIRITTAFFLLVVGPFALVEPVAGVPFMLVGTAVMSIVGWGYWQSGRRWARLARGWFDIEIYRSEEDADEE